MTARQGGFTLVEISISVAVTLIALALVFQVTRTILVVYRSETRSVEITSFAARALDDIAAELAQCGYGLGAGVDCVVARAGADPGGARLTLRSNPEGVAAQLAAVSGEREARVGPAGADRFAPGDRVLLTDAAGRSERAEVTGRSGGSLELRSLDQPEGRLRHVFAPERGARVLKLREVHYFLEPEPEGPRYAVVKEEPGWGKRVLARALDGLSFAYLDAYGNEIAPAGVGETASLALVRVTIDFSVGPEGATRRTFRTAVALEPQSARVAFEQRGRGLRLVRFFYPLETPAGLAARPFADGGFFLGGGRSGDAAFLYRFLGRDGFLDARVESVTPLPEVREPVAALFGPENGPLSGSLFIASSGIRIGQLARVWPDEHGTVSPASRVTFFERTEALSQIGGMAFGIDGALYVTSAERGRVFRFRFDGEGKPQGPEEVGPVRGTPGSLVAGPDGSLYFLLHGAEGSAVWKIAFDETLSPGEPAELARLPGEAISLGIDPVSENLFVLVRERLGDVVVLEIPRRAFAAPAGDRDAVFSLDAFREETMEGSSPAGPGAGAELAERVSPRLPVALVPDELDFLGFDPAGFLYLGAREKDLVLKLDLDRGDPRYRVGVAAVVENGGRDAEGVPARVRLHAWQEEPAGR